MIEQQCDLPEFGPVKTDPPRDPLQIGIPARLITLSWAAVGCEFFCAEHNGELDPMYVGDTAYEVREWISRAIYGVKGGHFLWRRLMPDGWLEARKDGWRVVKVRCNLERVKE